MTEQSQRHDLSTFSLPLHRSSFGEESFPRFCLGLISILNDHHKRQAHAMAPPAPDLRSPALFKKLALAEKLLKLRMLENDDATQLIVTELESHMENLKGDYLLGIIRSIKKAQSRIQICSKSKYCAYTRDVSKNHMYEACQEVMKMFATLMKQLQSTQRQMVKMQKKQKEAQAAAHGGPSSQAHGQRAGSQQKSVNSHLPSQSF